MNATTRTNKYDATCEKCDRTVIAGTGILKGRMVGGSRRWLVEHTTCPVVRRIERCSGDVHGPADDECLGARCVQAMTTRRREASARYEADHGRYPYVGMTWPQVLEANEHFDGETEIRTAARTEWERRSGMCCSHHGDSFAPGDTSCWECRMEADEARRDREDG